MPLLHSLQNYCVLTKLRDFVAYPRCERVLEVSELKEKARSLYTIMISYCRRVSQDAPTGTQCSAPSVFTLPPDFSKSESGPDLLTFALSCLPSYNVSHLSCFSRTWHSLLMTVMLWKVPSSLPLSPLKTLTAKMESAPKLYLGNFQGDQELRYM